MGLSNSVLSKADLELMESIIEGVKQDIFQLFTSIHRSESIMEEYDTKKLTTFVPIEEEDLIGIKLVTAPVPVQKIKVGSLLKRGEFRKSWRKRYFHAYNKSDNFVVVYSVDPEGQQVKGCIECFGYGVESFSAEEVASFGDHGLKLVPNGRKASEKTNSPNCTARIWWLMAESERLVLKLSNPNICINLITHYSLLITIEGIVRTGRWYSRTHAEKHFQIR